VKAAIDAEVELRRIICYLLWFEAAKVDSLKADYNNIDLLSLEGGKGNYDLSIFTDIQDRDIREKVSDYFVKEGRVSGPEYFAINNPDKMKLFGIEDEELYKENLAAYRNSLLYKEEADRHINSLSTAITNLKLKIYSPQLKEIDEKIIGFKGNKIDFNAHIVFLTEKARSAGIDLKARCLVHGGVFFPETKPKATTSATVAGKSGPAARRNHVRC